MLLCAHTYTQTHTHTSTQSHTLAEGGRGGFSHPCRVIVSKDAEPPDLTSHNSSVTGSLSTPITEQKQQRSHRETSATHGLLHPNTHTHAHTHTHTQMCMRCVFFFYVTYLLEAQSRNTQSDTK